MGARCLIQTFSESCVSNLTFSPGNVLRCRFIFFWGRCAWQVVDDIKAREFTLCFLGVCQASTSEEVEYSIKVRLTLTKNVVSSFGILAG